MRLLMNKMMYLVVAACLLLAGCFHSAEPIEAWIVDADNAQPIKDVVVVAHWQQKGGMEGGNDVGQLMVMEAVTDEKGRFSFPGWGPKLILKGRIQDARPRLLIFKTGYQPLRLSNTVVSDYGYGIVLKSEWNGRTIKLGKAAVDPENRLWEFRLFNNALLTVTDDYKACEWKKIPNMLREIHKQRLALIAQGITGGNVGIRSVVEQLISNAEYASQDGGFGCGSPKDIFKTK